MRRGRIETETEVCVPEGLVLSPGGLILQQIRIRIPPRWRDVGHVATVVQTALGPCFISFTTHHSAVVIRWSF